MLDKEKIIERLEARQFSVEKENSKTIWFMNGEVSVYIKKEHLRQPLVIHPDNESRFGSLVSIRGVEADVPLRYYHNATMRAMPERFNGGQKPTKYGIAFGFVDAEALDAFLNQLLKNLPPSILVDIGKLDEQPVSTNRFELKNARVGQGKFRANLMACFDGTCPVTNVTQPDLLVASHIKPWHSSSDAERLDSNNGLLLAANVDALFDKGYISFDDSGGLLVSKMMEAKSLKVFGLRFDMRCELRDPARRRYLEFHRGTVFQG